MHGASQQVCELQDENIKSKSDPTKVAAQIGTLDQGLRHVEAAAHI